MKTADGNISNLQTSEAERSNKFWQVLALKGLPDQFRAIGAKMGGLIQLASDGKRR
jgi:hypothetical protein